MYQYILFNKPFQVLSQFSQEGDKLTLANFLKNLPKDVYPVGRLDYDSEGLLLLTNDNTLKHRLLEPKYKLPKTYWAQVEGEICIDAIHKLKTGVTISVNSKSYRTLPANAAPLDIELIQSINDRNPPIRFRKNSPTSWLSLEITEGKNRQVRKMTAAVNLPTLRLIRTAIANISINDLQPGTFRNLTKAEVQNLKRTIGMQ
jgi:23S rRNA pseudouridine2457 synthase